MNVLADAAVALIKCSFDYTSVQACSHLLPCTVKGCLTCIMQPWVGQQP
jgi:hypothetical protein